jgi:hypothetical protein
MTRSVLTMPMEVVVSFAQSVQIWELEVDLGSDLGCGLNLTDVIHEPHHPLIRFLKCSSEDVDTSTSGRDEPVSSAMLLGEIS